MQHNRWLGPLALLSGLLISGVSAYFSIYGLAKIFTDTMLAGILVFGVLEIGKLVSASWLYRNWKESPKFLKGFMVVAVAVMMAITSLGIFGYLSKAYVDKSAPVAIATIDQGAIESEISIEQDKVQRAKDSLNRLNSELAKKLDRDKNAQSLAGLRQQQTLVSQAETEVKDASSHLVDLQKRRAAKLTETHAVSADLGPITFIAKALFGDTANALDRAVTILIGCLVSVFDPLAIALLLAANFSFSQNGRVSTFAEKRNNSEPVRQNTSEVVLPKRKEEIFGPTPVSKEELAQYLGKTVIEEIPEQLNEDAIDESYDRNEQASTELSSLQDSHRS